MVIHRDGSPAPAAARPAAAEPAKTTGGKGGNAGNLMLAAVRGQAVPAIGTVEEAKTGSGNCGKCGNWRERGFGVHGVAETGKSLAETADTPCKNFARETVRSFTVSLSGSTQGAPRTSGFAMRYPSSGRCVHAVAV